MNMNNPDYVNMLKKMYPERTGEEEGDEDSQASPAKLKQLARKKELQGKAKTPGATRTQSPVKVVRNAIFSL